ncbi:hypothetical protein N865_07115 [Intrasporangium oryzae NRRL B-24470]|uniref:Uncharacterized protein n=1 Tax=Intrasporangium oryzae NRRL B-24470 TaxID=1386089 RepID=W9GE21_9MICO|nr:hypothetical protein N865_07115 [Intrasporangium oryzae NRRL B-24470]
MTRWTSSLIEVIGLEHCRGAVLQSAPAPVVGCRHSPPGDTHSMRLEPGRAGSARPLVLEMDDFDGWSRAIPSTVTPSA